MVFLDEDRKELINVFLEEAEKKIPGDDGFAKAIGFVETAIAFEAFINVLLANEPVIKKKREKFCSDYMQVFQINSENLREEIDNLKIELDREPLIDKRPKSKNPPLVINNIRDLGQIIEAVYRVRCNLIHGSKCISSETNRLLIRNSFHFLHKLMKIVLEKEGVFRG